MLCLLSLFLSIHLSLLSFLPSLLPIPDCHVSSPSCLFISLTSSHPHARTPRHYTTTSSTPLHLCPLPISPLPSSLPQPSLDVEAAPSPSVPSTPHRSTLLSSTPPYPISLFLPHHLSLARVTVAVAVAVAPRFLDHGPSLAGRVIIVAAALDPPLELQARALESPPPFFVLFTLTLARFSPSASPARPWPPRPSAGDWTSATTIYRSKS